MNIHNETAYANRSAHRLSVDVSDAVPSDWYSEVSAAIALLWDMI